MSMNPRQIILIGGGTRSGKSTFALSLARRLGPRRLFLATGQAFDDEMRARIDLHRRTRGEDFDTVEEPLAVPEALRRATGYDVVVLDCLTLWLSNLLLEGKDAGAIERHVYDLEMALSLRAVHCVIVTNEVGMGVVPESVLGRVFRDVTGLAHQRLSRLADEVYVGIMGTLLRIKPSPAFVPFGALNS